MKWYKHESNARHDARLQRVKLKYGMEGYGLYWWLLECIAGTVEAHNLTFQLEEDSELIAVATNIHQERVEEMMRYMVDLGLFESADGVVTCLKMATKTDEYTQKLLRNPKNVRTHSGHAPDKVPPNRIEQNRTEQKGKTPALEEVIAHWRAKGWTHDPQAFFDYFNEADWHDSKGRKVTHWKRNAATWNNSRNKDNPPQAPRRIQGI